MVDKVHWVISAAKPSRLRLVDFDDGASLICMLFKKKQKKANCQKKAFCVFQCDMKRRDVFIELPEKQRQ